MPDSRPLTPTGWHHPDALRRNNLDFLRFCLATLVIFSHSFALPVGSDAPEPLYQFSHAQLTLGGLAVDAFFVVSGLLITHSWLRSDRPLSFFRKRVLRIYPAFIAAILFCAFVVAPLASAPGARWFTPAQLPKLLKSLLTLGEYKSPTAFTNLPFPLLNGSVWTIRYEFLCYVGVALCGILGLLKSPKRLTPLFITAILVSLALLLANLHPTSPRLQSLLDRTLIWSRLIPYYLAGMTFYLLRAKIPYSTPLAFTSLLLILAACLVPPAIPLLLPIAGTYLLFYIAFHPNLNLHQFAKHGDFSYGIYLYAFPLQQLLLLHLGTSLHPLTLSLYSFPPSLLAGIASWFLVERWFLRLKKTTGPTPVVTEAAQGAA